MGGGDVEVRVLEDLVSGAPPEAWEKSHSTSIRVWEPAMRLKPGLAYRPALTLQSDPEACHPRPESQSSAI
eukprot:15450544-Alexandrium_andersonii.AAC.1